MSAKREIEVRKQMQGCEESVNGTREALCSESAVI